MERNFFEENTVEVAKKLLGCFLVHKTKEGKCVGKIVETEAYLKDDPASHSFNGKTLRNEPMFGRAGTAYVYFTYGMHYCFNIVTNKKGIGEAVLIRALEPIEGIELMKKRRGISEIQNLCNGPAKLVQAMGITKAYNRADLLKGNLIIFRPKKREFFEIACGKRVGITRGKELEYRFWIKGNQFVSNKPV